MNTRLTVIADHTAGTPTLSRRLLLGGALSGAAVLATGCSPGSIPIISPPDPDDEVRRGVAESEQALIAAYDAALVALPALRARLQVLRDQHQAHLTAVTQDLDVASPAPSGSVTPARGGQTAALRSLRRLEARATKQRIDACVAADDPELAELLARIAASESGHVVALTAGAS